MSREKPNTVSMAVAKSALVPKLRFPEFRGAEWVQKKLEDVAPLQRGFDLPSDLIRPGNIPIVYSNGVQKYHEIGMATAPGLVTGRSGTIGKIHFIEHGEYWPHNTSLWVTDFKSHIPRFVYYLYDSIGMGQFSSGSGVPTLNRNDVHVFSSAVPISSAEQQKIADCLSSLDELIAAQGRKVEALKTHKKGLMQQLFPSEGESLPRLRFPEFKDAGEWEWIELGEKVELLSGYPFDGPDISQDASGIPLLRGINVTEGRIRHNSEIDRYFTGSTEGLEKYRLQAADLVIGMDGSKVGKNSALISEPDAGALLIQRVARLRVKNTLLIQFIFQRINSPAFHAYVDRINTRSGSPHISAKQIKEFRICFPSDAEQQRIADCLSSLDALITTATQELDTLKTHKKGLMQQLFPSAEPAP